MQRIIMIMLWRNMGNRGEKVKNSFNLSGNDDIIEKGMHECRSVEKYYLERTRNAV